MNWITASSGSDRPRMTAEMRDEWERYLRRRRWISAIVIGIVTVVVAGSR